MSCVALQLHTPCDYEAAISSYITTSDKHTLAVPQKGLYALCLFEHSGKHTWSGCTICWWNPVPSLQEAQEAPWETRSSTFPYVTHSFQRQQYQTFGGTRIAPGNTGKQLPVYNNHFFCCPRVALASNCFWWCEIRGVCARTALNCKIL